MKGLHPVRGTPQARVCVLSCTADGWLRDTQVQPCVVYVRMENMSQDSPWSSQDPEVLEAAEILMSLRGTPAVAQALPTPKASGASEASAGVNAKLPRPSPKIGLKQKRIGEGKRDGVMKSKIRRNRKAEAGRPEEGEPQKEKAKKEKPYKCDICGTGYARPDHVKRHIATRHGRVRKMLECDICGSLHSRRDNLRPHRKNHGVDGPEPEPRAWFVAHNEDEEIISRWPADQPAPVTADGRAQVGEGEADAIDSPAPPAQEVQASEPPNGQTTTVTDTGTGSRWNPINKPRARV